MKSTSARWDVWISAGRVQYDLAALTFSGSSSSAASPMRTTPLISPPSCTSSRLAATSPCTRSEEHTSLQSQSNLVCRLLLEKKNHIARPRRNYRLRGDLGGRAHRRGHHLRQLTHSAQAGPGRAEGSGTRACALPR